MIVSILAVPIIVKNVGIDGYGVWESLLALAALSAMGQQALSSALLFQMGQAYGAQDHAGVARQARIAGTFVLLFGTVLVIAFAFLTPWFVSVMTIPTQFQSSALWILPWTIVALTVNGFAEISSSVMRGYQRVSAQVAIQTTGTVFNYLTVFVALALGQGLVSLLFGYSVAALFVWSAATWSAKRLCKQLIPLPALPTKAELSALAKPWGLLLVGYGSAALRDQTAKIVLSTMASATWVGYYSIALRLTAIINEASRFFYNPLIAAASATHGAGDTAGTGQLYSRTTRLLILIAGTLITLVVGLAERVIGLWIGHPVPQSAQILYLLVIGYGSAIVLTGSGTALCRAVGRVDIETRYVVLNLVSNIILTIVLVLWIGPIGTVISSAVTWAASSFYFSYILPKHIPVPLEVTSASRKALVLALACGAVLHFLSLALPMPEGRLAHLPYLFPLATIGATLYIGTASLLKLLPEGMIARATNRMKRRPKRD